MSYEGWADGDESLLSFLLREFSLGLYRIKWSSSSGVVTAGVEASDGGQRRVEAHSSG